MPREEYIAFIRVALYWLLRQPSLRIWPRRREKTTIAQAFAVVPQLRNRAPAIHRAPKLIPDAVHLRSDSEAAPRLISLQRSPLPRKLFSQLRDRSSKIAANTPLPWPSVLTATHLPPATPKDYINDYNVIARKVQSHAISQY